MAVAPISPVLAAFNADLDQSFGSEFKEASLADQRRRYDAFWRRYHAPRPPGIETRDYIVTARDGAKIAARLYRRRSLPSPAPLCLYFHGGGWALGSIDSHDLVTARLAEQAGIAVLSVDYRLAPEHKYPVPLQDCWDALAWAHENAGDLGVDVARIGVAGDSAGGTLAAGLALMARDRKGPRIHHQGLIYPALRAFGATDPDVHSPGLDTAALGFYFDLYFADPGQGRDPYAMPLEAGELSGLPSATIMVAGVDIVCGEGEAYAARLQAAGNAADLITAGGLPHTFVRIIHLDSNAGGAFAAFCRSLAIAYGGTAASPGGTAS